MDYDKHIKEIERRQKQMELDYAIEQEQIATVEDERRMWRQKQELVRRLFQKIEHNQSDKNKALSKKGFEEVKSLFNELKEQ